MVAVLPLPRREGGVRVNAFVSGGFLKQVAPHRVGSKLEGFIHICDYYTTLAALAGVDHVDERAAKAKLPPVSRTIIAGIWVTFFQECQQ